MPDERLSLPEKESYGSALRAVAEACDVDLNQGPTALMWAILNRIEEMADEALRLGKEVDKAEAKGGWRGSLLEARVEWEKENPRPEPLVRVERAIVRALRDAGFGGQCQVTREDGFDISTDDVIVRVEMNR